MTRSQRYIRSLRFKHGTKNHSVAKSQGAQPAIEPHDTRHHFQPAKLPSNDSAVNACSPTRLDPDATAGTHTLPKASPELPPDVQSLLSLALPQSRPAAAGHPFLRRAPVLPVEVIRMVLEEAWLSLLSFDPAARRSLYLAASQVCREWQKAMEEVAVRHVMVCLRSNEDLALYLAIGRQCLLRHSGAPSASHTGCTSLPAQAYGPPVTSTSDTIHGQRSLASVFRNASIHLYVPHPQELPAASGKQVFADRDVLHLDPARTALRSEWAPDTAAFLQLLRRIVPGVRRLSIRTRCDVGLNFRLTCAILNFVAALSTPTTLDFDTFIQPSETRGRPRDEVLFPWERIPSPALPLPRISSLRFREYPQCTCQRVVLGFGHAESYCFASQLISAFPNVKHLQIDTPVPLKHIRTPAALHTLTLTASRSSPTETSGASASRESIVGYDLRAALDVGFFRVSASVKRQRKVVFKTTEEEPIGWADAQAACNEHGVVLLRRLLQAQRILDSPVSRVEYLEMQD